MALETHMEATDEGFVVDLQNVTQRNDDCYQVCASGPAIQTFSWSDLTIEAKSRKSKCPRTILSHCAGSLSAGQMCAIMGPSGCGKSTLVSALSGRLTNASAMRGSIQINGKKVPNSLLQGLSGCVEQEDKLIGVLTVFESLKFSAKFVENKTDEETTARVASFIKLLGLSDCQDNQVAALFRKPISGGQKRRVSIGCQLLTEAKIIFLDEPTSGLDSCASLEVMSHVQSIARNNNCIIICAIHQPSSSILRLFDQLLLLSSGKTIYFGETAKAESYFYHYGVTQIPSYMGLSEGLLDIINFDFARREESQRCTLDELSGFWASSEELKRLCKTIKATQTSIHLIPIPPGRQDQKLPRLYRLLILLQRAFLKSYRDICGYWIRFFMYFCFGLVLGTIFFRLPPTADNALPKVLELFFAPAFLAFMTVAYTPSFIEDYKIYVDDHRNQLYGPAELILTNFLVGIPYLMLYSLSVSVLVYWISDFRPSGSGFFVWVAWFFLNFLCAESFVVFTVSLFPNFVVVLALVSFVNSLWLAVAGLAIPITSLNVFYKYIFHYIDPIAYVFQGLMINEFGQREYSCGEDCNCSYPGAPANSCTLSGQIVLDSYGISKDSTGRNFGICIAIAAVYRLLAFLSLKFQARRS